MFRRSASLAIPHRKSFAAILSLSLVLFGHTNRNVKLSHESQHEIAPCFGTFKTSSLLPTRRSGGRKTGLCFAGFVYLTFLGLLASHDSNPYPNRSRIARYNATKSGTSTGPMRPISLWAFHSAAASLLEQQQQPMSQHSPPMLLALIFHSLVFR